MGGKATKEEEKINENEEKKQNDTMKSKNPTLRRTIGLTIKYFSPKEKRQFSEDYSKEGDIGYNSIFKRCTVKSKRTGEIHVMELIPKKKLKIDSVQNNSEVYEERIDELIELDHPSILKLFYLYENKDNFRLVMEYCPLGDLFNYLNEVNPFSEPDAAYIMYQILSAVNYFHDKNIIHGNLKIESILISKKEGDKTLNIKISEFENRVFERREKSIFERTFDAPELFTDEYDEKCDLWSCGVIMCILLTKKSPFSGKTESQIIEKIRKGFLNFEQREWKNISPEAKELVSGLLTVDPTHRLTASQALEHQWLKNNKAKENFCYIKDKNIVTNLVSNINNYRRGPILQEMALSYLVKKNDDLKEVIEAIKFFKEIDKNNNDKINFDELYEELKKYNLEGNTEEIFKTLDSNENNYIEFNEFVRAAIDKSIFLTDKFLEDAFLFFCNNTNEEITQEQITKIFKEGGQTIKNKQDSLKEAATELKMIIREADLNGDGRISFEEFKIAMRKMLDKN